MASTKSVNSGFVIMVPTALFSLSGAGKEVLITCITPLLARLSLIINLSAERAGTISPFIDISALGRAIKSGDKIILSFIKYDSSNACTYNLGSFLISLSNARQYRRQYYI